MKILEDYSAPDSPNRWLDTWAEVSEHLNNGHRNLAAWPESVGGRPRKEAITFNSITKRKLGASGRTVLASPALIKVGRNNDQNGCLANASIACWSEKGARQRSAFSEEFLNEVDWPKLRSIIVKIQRQITKASPAKLRSYPIMPAAFDKLRTGEIGLGRRMHLRVTVCNANVTGRRIVRQRSFCTADPTGSQ